MNEAEKLKLEQELRKAAPLLNRLGGGADPLPDHVRARLNAALDRKMPLSASSPAVEAKPAANRPQEPERAPSWLEVWRWWIGLATAAAAVVLVVALNRPDPNLPPVIQVAMLDSVGTVRGTGEKPIETLQKQWKDAKPVEFDDTAKLKQWQEGWPADPKQPAVKILYNRDAGEVLVMVRTQSGSPINKVFPVKDESDLRVVLSAVTALIEQSFNR